MKPRLYQFMTSPYCAKVRKILEYKGLDFETVEVDYIERKELIAASGQMMVPALTLVSGETIVDSERIALRLEESHPEPTIFPLGWRGLHEALARYFDTELAEAMFRVAIPDKIAHFRSRGADHLAMWRLIRERRYGEGFCDRMVHEHAQILARAVELLRPLDEALSSRAFLIGRIGLADFALYGQLFHLAFTGELKIPPQLENLRAFFGRIDRISSRLDTAAS